MGLQACAGSRPELALLRSALLAVGQVWQLVPPFFSTDLFVLQAGDLPVACKSRLPTACRCFRSALRSRLDSFKGQTKSLR